MNDRYFISFLPSDRLRPETLIATTTVFSPQPCTRHSDPSDRGRRIFCCEVQKPSLTFDLSSAQPILPHPVFCEPAHNLWKGKTIGQKRTVKPNQIEVIDMSDTKQRHRNFCAAPLVPGPAWLRVLVPVQMHSNRFHVHFLFPWRTFCSPLKLNSLIKCFYTRILD